ncbi:MAG: shikimate kinase [Gemmatimonadetes bacterium]|nr:shikimate kinase [Gemmatimonadota bacterium]
MTPTALDRVLLIGFMGSGKTSVGKRVAARLGWRFIDFDDAIEAEAGISVSEVFTSRGEQYFRALEERVAQRLLAERHVVLASGGGWAAAAGRLEGVPAGTASFWLQVSAPEALRRASGAAGTRPLLARPDALEEAIRLIAWRAPYYKEATWAVDTERSSVDDVSASVLEILALEYREIRAE